MKSNIYYPVLLLLLMPLLAGAQQQPTFKFTAKQLVFDSSSWNQAGEIKLYSKVENLSNKSVAIKIDVFQFQNPPTWEMVLLCNETSCFPILETGSGLPAGLVQSSSSSKPYLTFSGGTLKNNGTAEVGLRAIDTTSKYSVDLLFKVNIGDPLSVNPAENMALSGDFRLHANYPNPFNPSTRIPFEIGGSRAVDAQINIYNIVGQKVAVAFNQRLMPGAYQVDWRAQDAFGQPLPSGMYFYELRAAKVRQTGTMLLVR